MERNRAEKNSKTWKGSNEKERAGKDRIIERESQSFTIETRSLVEDVPRVGGRVRRIRRSMDHSIVESRLKRS